MTALAISSSVVATQTHGLVEARALNLAQSRLLFDPNTPAPDSLIELLLIGVRDGVEPHERAALTLCRELFIANRTEGSEIMAVTGVLDGWARQLHAAELAGGQPAGLSIKQLGAAVRGPLGVLSGPAVCPLDAADAVRAIDTATLGCPRERLAARSLRNELGPRKHDRLLELYDRAHPAPPEDLA